MSGSSEKTGASTDKIQIRGYDYVEFFVGSAKLWAYWHAKALGFDIRGYLGPETGVRDKVSYYCVKNNIQWVFTSAIRPTQYDISSFVTRHGDGVKRWTVAVRDVRSAFNYAFKHGGIMVQRPTKSENEFGYVEEAAIKLYDDTELGFVNRDQYKGIFKPGFGPPVQSIAIERAETSIVAIDHIVGNVAENEMNLWAEYFNKALEFEQMLHFGAGDISTQYSSLMSKVMKSKDSAIKVPINEPFDGIKKSQIEEFLEEYRGSGIQHIALMTTDIVGTIRAMRKNGVEFLTVPGTYYDALEKKIRDRGIKLKQRFEDIRELGILCDVEGEGYLLQLFTKPVSDRPTLFYEIIQREQGAQGFGQGNFQALFESIEADQARRGNLVDRER